MRRAPAAVVLAVLGLGVMSASLLVPASAAAQDGECELARVGGFTYRVRFDSVSFVYHATGGVDYRCSDGMRILADSAVVFESNEQVQLFGRVHLEDEVTELDADTAHYFGGLKRLNAWSNVTVTDRQSGAIISGHRVSLDRATEVRPMDRMIVYEGEPHATVFPVLRPQAPDSAEVADSTEVADSEQVADSAQVEDSAEVAGSAQVADSVQVEDTAQVEDSLQPPDSGEVADSVEAPGDTQVQDSVVAGDTLAVVDAPITEVEPSPPAEPTDAQEDSTEAATDPAPLEVSSDETVAEETTDPAPTEEGADPAPDEAAPEVEPIRLPPYEIDADQFVLEGRRYFRASGEVVVVRDSLYAQGDSLDYDQEVGAMSIFGDARVEGQSYVLTASTVSVTPTSGLREELLARRDARLSGEDVDMAAPAIRMFLEAGQVNRLVAIGEIPPLPGEPQTVDTEGLSAGDAARVQALADQAAQEADSTAAADSLFRPSVRADQFGLSGDSIDVLSPGQVLDLVTAVGAARAEGLADDTLMAADLPEVARRDWMEGDTVIADFSTAEPADSTENTDVSGTSSPGQRTRLETLTAVGTARSLYRMIDSDTAQAEPDTLPADLDTVVADTADPPAGADAEPTAAGSTPADSVATDTVGSAQDARPALHWVEGEKIIVYMEGREVVSMDVEGQTVGYHLEPRPPGAPADSTDAGDSTTVATDSTATDSTIAAPDSAAVVPDTTTTVPGGGAVDPDTTIAAPDSAAVDPDTTTAAREGGAANSDTTAGRSDGAAMRPEATIAGRDTTALPSDAPWASQPNTRRRPPIEKEGRK